MLKSRSVELEIMDDLEVSGPVIDQTLRELDVINRKLGGNAISLSVFKKLLKTSEINSVADLGCGGADILLEMAAIAKKHNKKVSFIGIDANSNIVRYAQNHTSKWRNISIQCENIFSETFRNLQFDIIHCCLFTHHFTETQLVDLFSCFKKQAKKGIIINDLHRHWLAYHSIKLITRLFSKSYMVRNDAAISVARGFKRHELEEIFAKAGISNYQINWKWAFRWQIVIICGE